MTFFETCRPQNMSALNIDCEQIFKADGELCILFLEKGSGWVFFAKDDAQNLLPGDVLVFCQDLQLRPVGSCQVFYTQIVGLAAKAFLAQFSFDVKIIKRENFCHSFGLLQEFAAQAGRQDIYSASALAYTALCHIAKAMAAKNAVPALVATAVAEIREHYAQVYGIEELADTLLVNKSHLIRIFSANMGISPGRYLTMVRVENAKRLLQQGQYSLEVIASLCGFSGANYLCKVFKAHTNQTPTAWRQSAQAGSHAAFTVFEEQVYL